MMTSIGSRIRRSNIDLTCWLLAGLLALGLKLHYSRASSEQLDWILAPTAALAGVLTGEHFAPESGAGYVNGDRRLVIAPACAGVNFMIAAFALAAVAGLRRIAGRPRRLAWVAAGLAAAYGLTVAVNAVRIAATARLYENPAPVFLSPGALHRVAGVVLYLGALSVFHTALSAFFERPAARNPAAGLVPLGWYLAVTLGVPLANGALQRDAVGFGHHAAAVLTTGLAVFLTGFLIRFFLRRRPFAAPPGDPLSRRRL